MNFHLVVTHPFGSYKAGDRIEDAAAIEAAMKANPHHVVRIAAPAPTAAMPLSEPDPEPEH